MKFKIATLLGIIAGSLALAGGGLLYWQSIRGGSSQSQSLMGQPASPDTQAPSQRVLDEQKAALLSAINDAGEKEDYERLGDVLKEAYAQKYMTEKEFSEAESRAYVKATAIFDKGDTQRALDIGTSVYNKVPEGWRFRYLRVRALERFGREALAKSDLDAAEKHAQTMLSMMFRPEGAELMADIYIVRINNALKADDMVSARTLYSFIKDYELSAGTKQKLDELAKQIK